MAVALDHMSVPARDKVATAEFFARLFGVAYEGPRRDYAPVIVNANLTLNFEASAVPETHHYAFRVEGPEFDAVLDRVRQAQIPFGTSTRVQDGEVYAREGVRGFFFQDPNGHGLEIITRE